MDNQYAVRGIMQSVEHVNVCAQGSRLVVMGEDFCETFEVSEYHCPLIRR
jgi:hypothetical protein